MKLIPCQLRSPFRKTLFVSHWCPYQSLVLGYFGSSLSFESCLSSLLRPFDRKVLQDRVCQLLCFRLALVAALVVLDCLLWNRWRRWWRDCYLFDSLLGSFLCDEGLHHASGSDGVIGGGVDDRLPDCSSAGRFCGRVDGLLVNGQRDRVALRRLRQQLLQQDSQLRRN